MRNNKAILDEAARSVRRTFIGTVAGTIGMFAVVGAAGAYGMPENLTAQALSAAMAKFNLKFPREPSASRDPSWSSPVVLSRRCEASPVSQVSDRAAEELRCVARSSRQNRRRARLRRSRSAVEPPTLAPDGCQPAPTC